MPDESKWHMPPALMGVGERIERHPRTKCNPPVCGLEPTVPADQTMMERLAEQEARRVVADRNQAATSLARAADEMARAERLLRGLGDNTIETEAMVSLVSKAQTSLRYARIIVGGGNSA